jgi:prevent-host-death family protein
MAPRDGETGCKTIGIRELKAHLSAYLHRVKAGAVLVISEHGKPICRIVPEAVPESDRIAELARTGLIAWNGRKLEDRGPVARLEGKKTVADLLLEDRE